MTTKIVTIRLTMQEANLLLNAANRMERDDAWDAISDEDALESAQQKLAALLAKGEPS